MLSLIGHFRERLLPPICQGLLAILLVLDLERLLKPGMRPQRLIQLHIGFWKDTNLLPSSSASFDELGLLLNQLGLVLLSRAATAMTRLGPSRAAHQFAIGSPMPSTSLMARAPPS